MVDTFDVIAMGRLGVDIYPQQTGVGLADVETFAKYLGGTAGNVAAALRDFGVDDRYVPRGRSAVGPGGAAARLRHGRQPGRVRDGGRCT
jgi:5-dehydro-2-deoxygluconokinase